MSTLKYEQLKQIVKNNIRDGIWKPGQKIPAENMLCKQFDVSKTTVKKAKNDLLMEGILETLPGRKGAFIKQTATTGSPTAGLIGVAINDINDPHFALILKGVEDTLWENKLHTIICNAYYDVEKVEAYMYSLIEQNVAGVIFTPVVGTEYLENNRRIVRLLDGHRIPYVMVDRYLPGLFLNAVVSDNLQGSKDLTTSLLGKGHQRILVITGVECSSMNERVRGHLEALQEAGIEHDPHLLINADDIVLQEESLQEKEELERVRGLVERAGNFTACYTMNSPLLYAAMQMFCPRADPPAVIPFEIATYDYSIKELFGHTNRVTIAKQPGYQMGWEAAKLLLKNIKNPHQYTAHMAIRTEIIEEILNPAQWALP
ncbi:MAG: GntR family transcriptional regulator [bacterium]|nr:GntR family transcriptional regulator [bacterium]